MSAHDVPPRGPCALDNGFGIVDQNVIPEIVSDASAPSMHVAYNPASNRQTGDSADANGNILPSGGGYQYDIFNRITSASGASYGYDAQNHRILRTDSSGNQFYALWGADGKKLCETNIYGTVTDSWAYFGGKTIMHGYGYVNADRLGSIGKFYPYGQERPSAAANDTEKFTGYFRDSATGLDYADQRYHQPGMGRFMTADPAASSAKASDPGSYNRYAYTRGDPVNRTDPAGTDDCDGTVSALLSCSTGCGLLDPSCGTTSGDLGSCADGSIPFETDEGPTCPQPGPPESTAPPSQITCVQALTASIQSFLQTNDAPLLTWDANLAQDLVDLGTRWNIDPRLFVSIATVESGGGNKLQGNNPYGLKDGPYRSYQSANSSEGRTVNKYVNVLGYGIAQMYNGNKGSYCQGAGCQAAGKSISRILSSFSENSAAGLSAGDPSNLADPCLK